MPLMVLAEVLISVAVVGRAVSTAGLRARVTPDAYLGRVTAAYSVVTQGATPLGALAGGLVAGHWSTGAALWTGALVMAVPLLLLLLSPPARHRRLPAKWEVRPSGPHRRVRRPGPRHRALPAFSPPGARLRPAPGRSACRPTVRIPNMNIRSTDDFQPTS
ncbi:hypothetical protein [Streptomyces sp. NPDC014006]|uniref:hypothetical protein n=1 Tax=Streptomyces sp. NPDC014006 TaxID=3364870 RepID=UPI0036F95EEB